MVSLTKHIDIDKCKYSGYGIGFDRKATVSIDNGFGRNCIIFEIEKSPSAHIDNKKKEILILSEDSAQGLDGTTLTAGKKYSVNFSEHNKNFCLSLDYNGASSYLFVNGIEIHKFKQKILKL